MNTKTETQMDPQMGFENGLTIEHIMLSITVVHTNKIMQYDDSAAGILRRELMKYHGVKSVNPEVFYDHTKIEKHSEGCECGKCTFKMETS